MPFDNKDTNSNKNGIRGIANAMFRILTSFGSNRPMQIRKITDNYSVSGQIAPTDVALIKAAGFKTIMCNRPDGEANGQPTADMIKQIAKDHDMNFRYVPMSPRGLGATTLDDFAAVISKEPGPVFAYCRSGNRCTILWNATQN